MPRKQNIIITLGRIIRTVKLINICTLFLMEQRNAWGEYSIEYVANEGMQQRIGKTRVMTSETIT